MAEPIFNEKLGVFESTVELDLTQQKSQGLFEKMRTKAQAISGSTLPKRDILVEAPVFPERPESDFVSVDGSPESNAIIERDILNNYNGQNDQDSAIPGQTRLVTPTDVDGGGFVENTPTEDLGFSKADIAFRKQYGMTPEEAIAGNGSGDNSYVENLVRSAGSGAITAVSGIADASTTLGANFLRSLDENLDIGTYSEESAELAKTFFDDLKTAKRADAITGYDRSFMENQLDSSLKHFKEGNIFQGIFEGAKGGPDALIGSLPYMALLYTGTGVVSIIGSEYNDSYNEYTENNNGQEPTPARAALMLTGDIVKTLLEKIPFDKALKGNSMMGDGLKKIIDSVPNSAKKDLGIIIAKRLGTSLLNVAEEAAQEGIQTAIDYFNREFGTAKDRGFNYDEFYKAMIGGGAAGGTIATARHAPGGTVESSKLILGKMNQRRVDNGEKSSASNINPNDREFVEDMQAADLEAGETLSSVHKDAVVSVEDITLDNIKEKAGDNKVIKDAVLKQIEKQKNEAVSTRIDTDEEYKSEFITDAEALVQDMLNNIPDKEVKATMESLHLSGLTKASTPEQVNSSISSMSTKDLSSLMLDAYPEIAGEVGFKNADVDLESVKNDIKTKSKQFSDIIDEKIKGLKRTQSNTKKGKSVDRQDGNVELKTDLTAGFFKQLIDGKNSKKAKNELSRYTTEAINKFVSSKEATPRQKSLAKVVLKNRNNANKFHKVGSVKQGNGKLINIEEQLSNNKASTMAVLRSKLSRNTIESKEEADNIRQLIDGALDLGHLSELQAKVLTKRLDRTSKDAETTTATKDTSEPTSDTSTSEETVKSEPKEDAKPKEEEDTIDVEDTESLEAREYLRQNGLDPETVANYSPAEAKQTKAIGEKICPA